jgi:hypothetical protein
MDTKYTVIRASGHQGDCWHTDRTFDSLHKARKYVEARETFNPDSDWYNIRIMAHRKSLVDLMKKHDHNAVRFNDGTRAVLDWEEQGV